MSLMFFLLSLAFAQNQHTDWSFSEASHIPIQNGGRIKPLDSFARDVILFTTGQKTFHKWEPLDLLFSWISHPHDWQKEAIIHVGREDVRQKLGLDPKQTFFTPDELSHNLMLANHGDGPASKQESPQDKEVKLVLQRVGLFHSIISGGAWLLTPQVHPEAWKSVASEDPEGRSIRDTFVQVVRAYQTENADLFSRFSKNLSSQIVSQLPDFESTAFEAEIIFYKTRPFLFAWMGYLFAAFGWLICASSKKKIWSRLAWGATSAGVGFHVFGTILRCVIAGRPPVTNMYESVLWVSFGISIFSFVLYYIHRQKVVLSVSCTLAALGLILADAAPAVLDPSIRPLVPVLRSNYWLTIHVLTITLGYAAFALTLGLANVTLFQYLKPSPNSGRIGALNQLTYRAMQFGVVLIAAGTILGGVWADYSWGRFWGWDPKEVWALITLLSYLVILHARYAQWVGAFGFAAWSAVSFLSVVMAWYGVNFILGAGLHSYGFSSGGLPFVLSLVGGQLLYVAGVALYRQMHLRPIVS